MKVHILDKKEERDPNNEESYSKCYLCKVSLLEYVESIPEDYMGFEVQRGIVSNKYLDDLADTIRNKRHIPPIVLISDDFIVDGEDAEVVKFKILDGLQRTHRMKVIFDTLTLMLKLGEISLIKENPNKFSRKYSSKIKTIGSNSKLIRKLAGLNCESLSKASEFFEEGDIWVEVWVGLSREEQVRKMLMLNAGHKAVNIKHQLEILFSNTLLMLEELSSDGISFIREKEQTSIQYSKSRTLGSYHYSHVISALVAISAGKLVVTNSDFVSDVQSGVIEGVDLIEGFDFKFLKNIMDFLYALDMSIYRKFDGIGLQWIGREVVLVGLFGAIGSYSKEHGVEIHCMLEKLLFKVDDISEYLNIDGFERERNNVKLNKVNVGNVNRKAVYAAFTDFLNDSNFKGWGLYFGGKNEL